MSQSTCKDKHKKYENDKETSVFPLVVLHFQDSLENWYYFLLIKKKHKKVKTDSSHLSHLFSSSDEQTVI